MRTRHYRSRCVWICSIKTYYSVLQEQKKSDSFTDQQTAPMGIITPAIKYLKVVIPAEAGIQEGTGCRIKPVLDLIGDPA